MIIQSCGKKKLEKAAGLRHKSSIDLPNVLWCYLNHSPLITTQELQTSSLNTPLNKTGISILCFPS